MRAFGKYRILSGALIIFYALILSACSVTRHLKPNEVLVSKIEFKGFDKKWKSEMKKYVATSQVPNNFIDLQTYYLFNRNGKRDWGTPPALLDSSLIELSRIQIERFLQSKGYLDASVNAEISTQRKKAKIIFKAKEGPSYLINRFSYQIQDSALVGFYVSESSLIKSGVPYDADLLSAERDRIYNQMRLSGYYFFGKQYIHFEIDSNKQNRVVDIAMVISKPENGNKHQRYRFGNTYFEIEGEHHLSRKDSIIYKDQYYFIDRSKKLSSRNFFYYLYYQKGDWYFPPRERIVLSRLTDMGLFKSVDAGFKKNATDSTLLDMNFKMSLRKKMMNKISGDFNFNDVSYGFNIGNTFSNINVFGGGERLNVLLKAGLRTDNEATSGISSLANQSYQVKVDLSIPKIISPIKFSNSIGQYGIPKTNFSTSYIMYEQRDAFRRDAFINELSYIWLEGINKYHKFSPLNIEFVRGQLAAGFKDILISRGDYAYLYTIDRSVFTLGSQYLYSYNANKLTSLSNFWYLQMNMDVAGHSLQLYDLVFGLPKTSDGFKTIFETPFSQYIRPEIDLRKYWHINGEQVFITRFNFGAGVPLGNSNALTLEKYFFAGGFTSNRAWYARTLGPGNYVRKEDSINDLIGSIGHFGEIKGEVNAEYRFGILKLGSGMKLNGATFVDMGNIWRLKKETETPDGEIDLKHLGKQIAIGAGMGLRLDLMFFVFRFDIGVKMKDPQLGDGDQWVIKNFAFGNNQFKQDFLSTYGREYSFLQYNLGIGMPF